MGTKVAEHLSLCLSVNEHGKSLLLEYAESLGNCCIFFFFFLLLNSSLASLSPWLVELPRRGTRSSHPEAPGRQVSGAALLTVTGENVPVGGRDSHAPGTAQPHCFQLGGLGPAAMTGGAEGLLKDGAEGYQGLGARRLAAMALAPGQEHHLRREGKWLPWGVPKPQRGPAAP